MGRRKERKTGDRSSPKVMQRMQDGVGGAFRFGSTLGSLEWAERYRTLTTGESATAGRYSASITPYVEEWYNAVDCPTTEQVTIVAGAQIGKTLWLTNILGSMIDQTPSNIMWVWPDLEQAKKFVRHRLKILLETPRLKSRIGTHGRGSATSRQEQIVFEGGSLNFVGSNNPSSLASLPCRFLICDEVDRLNAETSEGSAIELAKARTRTFFNRKILLTSTPTDKGTSQIDAQFRLGTMERYCFPCGCGAMDEISYVNLSYEWDGKGVKGEILYVCPKCGLAHTEREVRAVLEGGRFQWVAEHPERTNHRSFWVNAFVSPFITWKEIVTQVEKARPDPNRFRVVKNTLLGELWEGDDIDRALGNDLLAGRMSYGTMPDGTIATVPDGVERLVCGIDTQDAYLAYLVMGAGPTGLYAIERGNISGQPSDDSVFDALKRNVLERRFMRADGTAMQISCGSWDTGGHYTSDVYRHVFGYRHGRCRLVAIKGQGGEGVASLRPPNMVPIGLKDTRKVQLQMLGVDSYKTRAMDFISRGLIGFSSNPIAGQDERFFEELLSERVEYHRGRANWVKIHRRNESLDCLVYALASFDMIGQRIEAITPRRPDTDVLAPIGTTMQPSVEKAPTGDSRGIVGDSVELRSVELRSGGSGAVELRSVELRSVELPSVPTPSVPTPSVPTPSVPTPSVPTPSVPTPLTQPNVQKQRRRIIRRGGGFDPRRGGFGW